jgi:hypothetical protein
MLDIPNIGAVCLGLIGAVFVVVAFIGFVGDINKFLGR